MALIYFEGTTKAQEDLAKDICMTLWQVYPGYDWSVRVGDGFCHIKLPLLGNGNWGMLKKFASIDHDAAVFKRVLIMRAGELLERANLARGRADEGMPETPIEGVPLKDQPRSMKDPVIVGVGEAEIRTVPRPQVLNS